MERSRYFAALYRRWFVVVLVGLLGLGLAAALTSSHSAKYRASTSLFFSVSGASSVSDLSQGATYTQNLMPSFAALATTAQVLDPVAQQLGLHKTDSQLAREIKTKTATGAVILQIFVTDSSASESAAIANAVAAQLAKSVGTLVAGGHSGRPEATQRHGGRAGARAARQGRFVGQKDEVCRRDC